MLRFLIVLLMAALASSGCAHLAQRADAATDAAVANAQATFPPGPDGEIIQYGQRLVTDTQKLLPNNITSAMSCASCHLDAGRKAYGGSFLGIYAKFPQWNKRSGRFIALQDRLAECFLYSMNGTPPAYYSREMIAMTAYIAWLSRGAAVGQGFEGQSYMNRITPEHEPDVPGGQALYAAKCAMCHGAGGAGSAAIGAPPLWGEHSFNDGAGMAHLDRMAPFIKYNMPANAPGSLSAQQAFDISAWVLTHDRPKFDPNRAVNFEQQSAKYF